MDIEKFLDTSLSIWVILLLSVAVEAQDDTSGWFELRVEDDFASGVIDMSHWLDAPAGNHGFVQMEGEGFVFEDGTPVTFWGVNIASRKPYIEHMEAEAWTRYLAKYGINAVRFHKFTTPAISDTVSTRLDPALFDKLDYFSATLKEKGIYYGWSHIYGHRPKPGDREKLLAYQEIKNIEVPWSHLNGTTSGLVNFAEDLQNLHIELTVNMLNHVNPYTGLRYADDPALNVIELQNEDNIFWGAIEKPLEQAPTYRALLNKKFSNWLREKYGSHEELVQVWGEETLQPGEHLTKNNIYPKPNHHWFSEEYRRARKENRPVKQHYLDRARFLYETQMSFYNRFVDSIRATGYNGPIVGSCWQAGEGITHFYNLYADYQAGIIDRHNYFGGGTGHSLKPGSFRNQAMVSRPGSGLLSTGMQMVADRPFVFSEWMELLPTEWIAESAPIIAAYGMGLQGWDASYIYASNQPGLTATLQAANHGVYNAESPLQASLYPALAQMIYRGDVKQGEVISTRNVHIPSLKEGRIGFDEYVEQDYDVKTFGGDVPSEALAAGRVPVAFTDRFESTIKPDLGAFWDRSKKVIRSNTGQLKWDYSGRGYFTVNTPGTKAVVGFASDKRHVLGNVSIHIETPFAVVLVSSLDKQQPISNTNRILVTTVARARNSGMRYNAGHTKLLEVGMAPVRMEPVRLKLHIKRREKPVVHILDHAGRRTGKTVSFSGRTIDLNGSLHKTMYYELEYPKL